MTLFLSFYLPVPSFINYYWNLGFLLFSFYLFQVFSGIAISFYYNSGVFTSFMSLVDFGLNYSYSWIFFRGHLFLSLLLMFLLYLHIYKVLFFSFKPTLFVWITGFFLLIIFSILCFLGYSLPVSNMSYWAFVVVFGLVSLLGFFINNLVDYLYGWLGFTDLLIFRFFSLHYLLSFVGLFIIVLHFLFIHFYGSSSSLSLQGFYLDSSSFYLIFILRDLYLLFLTLILISFIMFYYYNLGYDFDSFNEFDSLLTPISINPYFYFLFHFSLLKGIPSKSLGLFILVLSYLFLFIYIYFNSLSFYLNLLLSSYFILFFLLLFLSLSSLSCFMSPCSFLYLLLILFIFIY